VSVADLKTIESIRKLEGEMLERDCISVSKYTNHSSAVVLKRVLKYMSNFKLPMIVEAVFDSLKGDRVTYRKESSKKSRCVEKMSPEELVEFIRTGSCSSVHFNPQVLHFPGVLSKNEDGMLVLTARHALYVLEFKRELVDEFLKFNKPSKSINQHLFVYKKGFIRNFQDLKVDVEGDIRMDEAADVIQVEDIQVEEIQVEPDSKPILSSNVIHNSFNLAISGTSTTNSVLLLGKKTYGSTIEVTFTDIDPSMEAGLVDAALIRSAARSLIYSNLVMNDVFNDVYQSIILKNKLHNISQVSVQVVSTSDSSIEVFYILTIV
jgi:hypothetical protein